MALVYATDLRVFDGRNAADDADMSALVSVVSAWAGVADTWVSGTRPARRDAEATIDVLPGGEAAPEAWRVRLTHPDGDEPDVFWTVTASVTSGNGTYLAVRVDRSRTGALKPIMSDPRPPRFVSDVLRDERFLAMDDTFDISSNHTSVTLANVDRFAAFLMGAARRLPVIAFTPRDDEVLDATKFLEQNAGVAHVVLVQPEASWRLSDALPDGHSVYGGAVRIWWPGLTKSSVRWHHPLWTADRPASRIYREVAETVRRVAVSTSPSDQRFAAVESRERRREIVRFQEEINVYESLLQEATSARGSDDTVAIDALRRAREALEFAEIADQFRLDAEVRADTAERRSRELEAERDYYKHALIERGTGADADDIDEAAGGLRAEIDELVAALGRTAPPRVYRFGQRFLDSLESLGGGYRAKAAKACRAVVSADPDLLSKVEDHPLRTGPAGTAPQRIRSRDGAVARRAYVERETPSARRLHYWVCADSSIEFASLNIHDEMTIPE